MSAHRTFALAVVVLAGVAYAAPAAIAVPNGSFACRGDSLLLLLGDDPVAVDPLAASENGPCRDDSEGVDPGTVGNPSFGTITPRAAYATTDSHAPVNRAPQDGDGAVARAGIAEVTFVLGADTVRIRGLNANASITCQAGVPVLAGTSSIGSVVVNDDSIDIPEDGAAQDIPVGPATLHLNESMSDATTVVRQALRIETPLGSAIIGRAGVAAVGSPCEDNAVPPPPPPAAPTQFACRASAERVMPPIGNTFEPAVANPLHVPCRNTAIDTFSLDWPTAFNPLVRVRGNFAYTRGGFVDALAKAGAKEIVINTQPNPTTIDAVDAEAFMTCVGGKLAFSSSSRVGKVRIGTQEFRISDASAQRITSLGTLRLNWKLTGGGDLTRRAVWFQSSALGDVVVGEAKVGPGRTVC